MARATGYTCDRAECKSFDTAADGKKPGGWITVTVHTDNSAANSLDLCSDKCMMIVARERMGHKPPGRTTVKYEEIPGKYKRRTHSRWHKAEPKEDCQYCEAETGGDVAQTTGSESNGNE